MDRWIDIDEGVPQLFYTEGVDPIPAPARHVMRELEGITPPLPSPLYGSMTLSVVCVVCGPFG